MQISKWGNSLAVRLPAAVVEEASRPDRYRRRDFGTGYGRSSGYAQDRSYARPSQHRRVRPAEGRCCDEGKQR